jgi:putative ABC transport system permease protein
VGQFTLGSGFSADGAMMVSDANFARLFGIQRLERPSLGLVRLAGGADPDRVAAALRQIIPAEEVQVLTRAEMVRRETRYWLLGKSIGIIFLLGVVVACLVGVVVVFQVLSSDISERLAEYATLKAIGMTGRGVSGVVVQQALLLAATAYLPALLAATVLYEVTARVVLLPLSMDAGIAVTVFVLANVICVLSALISLRKLHQADPADLF